MFKSVKSQNANFFGYFQGAVPTMPRLRFSGLSEKGLTNIYSAEEMVRLFQGKTRTWKGNVRTREGNLILISIGGDIEAVGASICGVERGIEDFVV